MLQRCDTSGSEVVGVDVIGVAVISVAKRRKGLVQAFNGQAVGCVDTRRAQDGDLDAGPLAPLAQATFGIDPPAGASALRIQAARFVDLRATTIAINPRRTYVNQAPW